MKRHASATPAFCALLLVTLSATPLLLAGDDAGDKDKAALRGTWAPSSSESGGTADAEDEFKQYRLILDGDAFTIEKSGKLMLKGTVKLGALTTPKQIDMEITECPDNPDDKGKLLSGIYEVSGDDLKWCFAPPGASDRPREFVSRAGTDHILATFKREKK
jgi:uncharacterized protein (TIGR03067 family)